MKHVRTDHRKLLSLLLAVCMAFSCLSGLPLPAAAEEAEQDLVEFHKMTSLNDLQVGAHYIVMAAVSEEDIAPDGVTRYLFDGVTEVENSSNPAFPVQQSAEDYEAEVLYAAVTEKYVLTLNGFTNTSTATSTTATVDLRNQHNLKFKLGTGNANPAPLFNEGGGTIILAPDVSDNVEECWTLNNTGRYLRYRQIETEDETQNIFAVGGSSTSSLEIWTDASTELLAEDRFMEYEPLDLHLSDVQKGESMLIVYTDETSNKSYALTANGAVPVTVENMLVGDKTTTAITTSLSYAWTVEDNWGSRDLSDVKTGAPSTEGWTVLRNHLADNNGNYLWMSSSGFTQQNPSSWIYFYLDENGKIRVHGPDNEADRYLGWNGDAQSFLYGRTYDESVTVRIYGPVKDITNYTTRYVRLTSLQDLQDGQPLVVVLPRDDGRYTALGYDLVTKDWLFNVDKGTDAGVEYILVDSNQPIVFTPNILEFTTLDKARAVKLTNLQLAGNGYCFYPQNLNNQNPSAPFRTNPGSEAALANASATDDTTIYLRGNGNNYWLTCEDDANDRFTAKPISDARQEVELYVPANEAHNVVRYHDTNGNVSLSAYVQGPYTLRKPADVTKDGQLYTFVGWSTNSSFAGEAFLDQDASCNLYDSNWATSADAGLFSSYVEKDGYLYAEDGKQLEISAAKPETIKAYDLIGRCLASLVNTIDLTDGTYDEYIQDGVIDLYPIYAQVATAENAEHAIHAGENDETGVYRRIVAITDWKDEQGAAANPSAPEQKWLGFINIEVYKDGQPWGAPSKLYFSYHNDNAADLVIKFVDDAHNESDPKGLREFLLDEDDYPEQDQLGHFTIDAVYAVQGNSEDGLDCSLNWMQNNGGRLDNVQGGETVRVYVTTKYNAVYYLQNPNGGYNELEMGAWAEVAPAEYYTTSATDDMVQAVQESENPIIVSKDENNELMDPSAEGWFVLPDDGGNNPDISRGNYNVFLYLIDDSTYTIPIAAAPESQVPQGYILKSLNWTLKDRSNSKVEAVAYKAANGYTVTANGVDKDGNPVEGNTKHAYLQDASKHEGDNIYLYHLYADIAQPGSVKVSKVLEGDQADPDQLFTFTVTLFENTVGDYPLNGKRGGMEFVDGVATFTLKGGQSLQADDLPAGMHVLVAESDNEGYTVTQTCDKEGYYGITEEGTVCTVIAYDTVTATFTNRKGNVPQPATPQTGDDTNLGLWVALMVLSLACVVALSGRRGTKRGK